MEIYRLLDKLQAMLLGMLLALVVIVRGNAASATKLATARTIGLSGGATGTATSFNGTGNITIPVTSLDASKLTGTASVSTTGNAGTATKLATARNIKIQGAVSGNANFDGSGNITITATQANISVLTGTFTATASTAQKVKTITYPSGYTKDNCVVISFGTKYNNGTTGYSFGNHPNNSTGIMYSTNEHDATLSDNGIDLWYNNITENNKTIAYKVIIMKVS